MGAAFSVSNLSSTLGIGSAVVTLTPSPYASILSAEVEANKDFDPATNIATMPPPPDKAANGPGGFTSRLSKSAKKIKKNKK